MDDIDKFILLQGNSDNTTTRLGPQIYRTIEKGEQREYLVDLSVYKDRKYSLYIIFYLLYNYKVQKFINLVGRGLPRIVINDEYYMVGF